MPIYFCVVLDSVFFRNFILKDQGGVWGISFVGIIQYFGTQYLLWSGLARAGKSEKSKSGTGK